MVSNNNSTESDINKNIIIQTSSSDEELEFSKKTLESLLQDSGTKRGLYVDKCIPGNIKVYLSSNGGLLIEMNQKFDNGSQVKIDNGDNMNRYDKICGPDDYLSVRRIKKQGGQIMTNDYGLFACAYMEGVRVSYLPNKDQLRKGLQYFFLKIFPKNIHNRIWRQKKSQKYENI